MRLLGYMYVERVGSPLAERVAAETWYHTIDLGGGGSDPGAFMTSAPHSRGFPSQPL